MATKDRDVMADPATLKAAGFSDQEILEAAGFSPDEITSHTPAPTGTIRSENGGDHVDLSGLNIFGIPIGKTPGLNYITDAINTVVDRGREASLRQDNSLANAFMRGIFDMPGEAVEFSKNVPSAVSNLLSNYQANAIYGDPDTSNDIVNGISQMPGMSMVPWVKSAWDMVPPGQGPETLGAIGMAAAGRTPEGAIPKALAEYLWSNLGAFGANQWEQLAGADVDTPLAEDASRALETTVSHAAPMVLNAPAMALAGKVSNAIAYPMIQASSRLGSFLDKDLNRAGAFFDTPESARTRQGIPMRDALKADDVRPLFERLPKPKGGSQENLFGVIKERVVSALDKTGELIGNLIGQLPAEASSSIGEVRSAKVWQDLERNVLGVRGGETAAVTRPVLMKELGAFADMAKEAGAISRDEVATYRRLLKRDQRFIQGGENSAFIENRKALTAREEKTLLDIQEKIDNTELSPQRLRELKTSYDSFAGHDRKGLPPEMLVKAEIYGDIAHAFRETLNSKFQQYASNLYEDFKKANRRFQTLKDLEPAIESRIKTIELRGTGQPVQGYQSTEGRGVPDKIGWGAKLASNVYPEITVPEMRLRRASLDPFDDMSRITPTIGRNIIRGAGLALNAPTYATKHIYEGIMNPYAGAALGIAAGQEGNPPTFRRSVEDLFATPGDQFPQELMENPEFNSLIKEATGMSPDNQAQLLTDFLKNNKDIARTFIESSPYPGYTVVKKEGNDYILDPYEQVAFRQKLSREETDPIWLTKKLKAFNDPDDPGRILRGGRVGMPTEPKSPSASTVKTGDNVRQDPPF